MEEGEVSQTSTPTPAPASASTAPADSGAWVKKTTRGGNMSLMTVEKRWVVISNALTKQQQACSAAAETTSTESAGVGASAAILFRHVTGRI